METVRNQQEMLENVERLRQYLYQNASLDAEFARDLVRKGICFVITEYQGKRFFPQADLSDTATTPGTTTSSTE